MQAFLLSTLDFHHLILLIYRQAKVIIRYQINLSGSKDEENLYCCGYLVVAVVAISDSRADCY